ncbi:hypothetical protein [Leptolyngbya sp. FACHB-711]|uniref:hypothetical protein n=1 Tax=unclassified Leptolyngbya TaxID=2650499 RepID=UPI001684FDFE|nr:hypothetical protein [Leptolyngbya sp. FACHB-711]MBD1848527.1 hypothetical protein [Cyanobacteria bacterium FACHB-502]MBD2025064.1 hypothetical protein [Leptolyngbya sp. FACHB-711]
MLTEEEQQIANGNGKSSNKRLSNKSSSPVPPVDPETADDELLALTAASDAITGTLAQAVEDLAQLTSGIYDQRDRITDAGAKAIATALNRNSIQCETLIKAFSRVQGEAPRPFAVAVVDLSPLQVSSPSLPQSYGSLLSLLSSGSTGSKLPVLENATTSNGKSITETTKALEVQPSGT